MNYGGGNGAEEAFDPAQKVRDEIWLDNLMAQVRPMKPSPKSTQVGGSHSAHEIARKAAEIVSGDRERQHGNKIKNFANIARLWNAYLAIRPDPKADLTEVDVAALMNQLKVARTQSGVYNPDDYVDMTGYSAVMGELAWVAQG